MRRTLLFILVVFNSLPLSRGQLGPSGLMPNVQMSRTVGGRVVTMKGDPIYGAMVIINNNFGGQYKIELTDRRGEFYYEYLTANMVLHECVYTFTVQKKNFRVAHTMAGDENSGKQVGVLITLQPLQEDPDVLSQSDLIKGVAPRLRQLGPADGLSPKDQKEYTRGAQEFLDHKHEDRAVPLFRKVAKQNASCVRCRTMLGLAELSWGDWNDGNMDLGRAVNAMIADKRLGWSEPMLAYGIIESWQHEPARASAYFLEALKYSPNDPLVLQELGRAQCQNADWEIASETLERAVDAGAGPQARLLHAEALLWAGTAHDAQAELDRYLNGREIKTMPPRVRTLAANIAEKKRDATVYAVALAKLRAHGEEPLDYIRHPPKDLPNFEPAKDQVPLPAILQSVGEKVAEIYKNLPNTSSLERIRQEALNHTGEARWGLNQKFRYLCLIPQFPWGPTVDEYRVDARGNLTVPRGLNQNLMLTSGFLGAALIFHPAYQKGNQYRYLGQQKTKGRKALVLAFAQEPAQSKIYGSFVVGSTRKLTYVQGLAWVDADSFEIVRLKTDLLYPLPQVRLKTETTDIEFSEVPFASVGEKFWLPHDVTVTLDWSGRRLRNRHQYSDFLVFNVEEKHKIGLPSTAKLSPAEPPGREEVR